MGRVCEGLRWRAQAGLHGLNGLPHAIDRAVEFVEPLGQLHHGDERPTIELVCARRVGPDHLVDEPTHEPVPASHALPV